MKEECSLTSLQDTQREGSSSTPHLVHVNKLSTQERARREKHADPEMSSGTEEDLLRMSLTGTLPPESQASFESAKDAGNVAFRERRYKDAVRHYTAAEGINPLSPVPPANRAMAHLKLSNYHGAKADASVALDLYHALPREVQPTSLPVKILLRRATANFELLLYALAAEDFAAVLELDSKNEPAKAQLKLLKEKFGVTPGRTAAASTAERGKGTSRKIQLITESVNASVPERRQGVPAHVTVGSIQDETALVELPQNVMDTLVSRWSAVPPMSSLEFERVWKSLQNDQAAQAQYLIHTVGPVRIANGLFGEGLTPQQLEEVVTVLTIALERNRSDGRRVADILLAMTKVSRFNMLLMFLSPEEKVPVSALVNSLQKHGVSAQHISLLKECYK